MALRRIHSATLLTSSLVLIASLPSGCALQPSPAPTPQVPEKYANVAAAVSGNGPREDWFRAFASDELDALETEALSGNFDVATASARVMQAEARARQARSATLPSVSAGGNVNYFSGHSNEGSAHETDWAGLLSASYELDFWGKNRALAASARDQARASRADRDTVALTTLAGVAIRYFEVITLRERIAIAHENVKIAQALLDVVESRFQAGLANPVEVATQRTALASTALAIPDLEQKEQEATAAIAILLGRTPEGFALHGTSLSELQEPAVTVGLPSDLLRRRPDIATAESNLAAAGADLTAARAALFPSLSLTAAGGVQNPAVNAAVITLGGVGPSLALGASLSQPIFDGGRLRAQRAEAEAKVTEATIAYRAAIVSALVDVENALAALSHLDAAREYQGEALSQSERAFEGARLRYEAGSGDFLTVLEAQRALYVARDQNLQYRLQRLETLVNLNKALGGGWQTSEAAAVTLRPEAKESAAKYPPPALSLH